jgi:prepilin-type processing-associated H-X9-DG protein
MIVAIMIALSTHLFRISRAAAKRSQCTSNLHQIYQYLLIYLEDSNDRLGKIKDLDDGVAPEENSARFLKDILEDFFSKKNGQPVDLTEIFHCPANPVYGEYYKKEGGGSYDFRNELTRTYQHFTFSQVKNPQDKILMGDHHVGWHDYSYVLGESHINVLYADGHVAWITEDEWQENLKVGLLN